MFGHQHGFGVHQGPRGMGGWGRGFAGYGGPWSGGHGFGPRERGFGPEEWAGEAAEEGDETMFDKERGGRGGRGPGREWPGFGGPGFGGFGRGAGRGERPLEQGDLRWLVLSLIAEQPRHGYEIIKAVEEMMGGHYTPSPGVVYPTLTYLEETGLIAGEAQGAKMLYNITDAGREALNANAAEVGAMRERIAQTRARFGGPPAPEMMRAMGNLRAAIGVRLSKGELTPESLAVITAALDRAAGEIERS